MNDQETLDYVRWAFYSHFKGQLVEAAIGKCSRVGAKEEGCSQTFLSRVYTKSSYTGMVRGGGFCADPGNLLTTSDRTQTVHGATSQLQLPLQLLLPVFC